MADTIATSLVLELSRAERSADPFAFRFAPQQYLLRGAGGVYGAAEFAWDVSLLTTLAAIQQPGRDPAEVQRIGEMLRGFLVAAGGSTLMAEIAEARAHERRVVVTVRSAAAELYALPWELLSLRDSGQHLGELPGVLLRHEWPEDPGTARDDEDAREGGRVLLAWSSAGGAVPADAHVAALRRAADDACFPFVPTRDVLGHATCEALVEALARARDAGEPVAVLHLLCHGGATGATYGLVLDAAAGGHAVVDAGRLRQLLAPFAGSLRLVVLAACDSGAVGAPGNHLGSVAQALHRAGVAAVVASRYPLAVSAANVLCETLYRGLMVELRSLEEVLLAARARLAADPDSLAWASLQLYARARAGDDTRPLSVRPYRGLLAFEAEHRRLFFGRAAEVDEVLARVDRLQADGAPRLVAIVGASGTGKSSLLLAGAVPALVDRGLRAARMRPGRDPMAALAAMTGASLIVVDQLEELFTHVDAPAVREAFVRRLWRLADEATVLVSLRVDFLGRCGELTIDDERRLDAVLYAPEHRVFVAQMPAAAMLAAIDGPARQVGLALEAGLGRRILADVAGSPGALPLVEDTLDLLWQRRRGRLLTQAAYDEVGGVTGALQRRADRLIDELDPPAQAAARRLVVRLVDPGEDSTQATRRRVATATLRPRDAARAASFDAVLERLVRARLVVRAGAGAEETVELAHEALIRSWQRLSDWAREDRRALAELATVEAWAGEWRARGTLLGPRQLGHAEEVAERQPGELGDDARAMIAASQARARRSQRRRRALVVASLVVAAVLAVLSLVADAARRQADAAEALARARGDDLDRAGKRAHKMLIDSYLEQGGQLLAGLRDPGRALHWFARALHEGGDGPALRFLIAQAMPAIDAQLAVMPASDRSIQAVGFAADGREAVAAAIDGTVSVWRLDDGALLRRVGAPQAGLTAVDLVPGGAAAIVHASDGHTQRWDLATGRAGPSFAAGSGMGRVLLGGDDRVVRVSVTAPDIRVWTATTGAQEGSFAVDLEGPVNAAAWSPDGRWLFAGVGESTCHGFVWEVASGRRIGPLAIGRPDRRDLLREEVCLEARFTAAGDRLVVGTSQALYVFGAPFTAASRWRSSVGEIAAITLSPDGQTIAAGLSDTLVGLWGTEDERMIGPLVGHIDRVVALAFSPDGRRLLSASFDGVVRVWDAHAGRPLGALVGHRGPVYALALAADGGRALTGDVDGTMILWDVRPPARASDGPEGTSLLDEAGWAALSDRKRSVPEDRLVGGARATGSLVAVTLRGDRVNVDAFGPAGFAAIVSAPRERVTSLELSVDGRRIVGVVDRRRRVWDAATGRELGDFRAEERPPETRPAAELERRIRCRSPLRFVGDQLVPRTDRDPDCDP